MIIWMYNVTYANSQGRRTTYCVCWMSKSQVIGVFEDFKRRYLNDDCTPKPYPNGKGFYDIVDVAITKEDFLLGA